MNQGKYIFAQIMELVSYKQFQLYYTKSQNTAGKELKSIAHLLAKTDKESFVGMLHDWLVKWKAFLNERSINPETGKSKYTHTRLRSAHRSLVTNLPWLFTWYDNIGLNIPNTTNLLEGSFTDLKNKLRNHNGLNRNRKSKIIIEFFKA